MKAWSVGLLVLFCLPLMVAVGDSSVWDANEAFYVQTPREMVQSGNWLLPTFNGQARLNKPPLSYWLVAAGYRLFGVHLLVERWLLVLVGIGCVLAVHWIGRILFDPRTALLATGVFATTFRFLILERRLLIDALLLLWVLLAIAFFLLWMDKGRSRDWLLSCLAFGLGFLTKGPVAFLPVVFLSIYVAFSRHQIRMKKPHLLLGIMLTGTVSAFWFVLVGVQIGWEPVYRFFVAENLGRYVSADFGPKRGLLYYPGVFLADFFPWSLFFLAALLRGRHRLVTSRETVQRQPLKLLFPWILTYALFFSLSSNKQEYYIVALYPAAALWLVLYLKQPPWARSLRLVGAFAVGMLSLLLGWLSSQLFPDSALGLLPPLLLAATILPLVSCQGRLLVASWSIFYLAALAIYLPLFERYKPVVGLASTINQQLEQNPNWESVRVGYYRFTAPSLRFYLNRDIFEIYDTAQAVEILNGPQPALLLMTHADYLDLTKRVKRPLQIVASRPRLYTTARTFLTGIKDGPFTDLTTTWTRRICLISNQAE